MDISGSSKDSVSPTQCPKVREKIYISFIILSSSEKLNCIILDEDFHRYVLNSNQVKSCFLVVELERHFDLVVDDKAGRLGDMLGGNIRFLKISTFKW